MQHIDKNNAAAEAGANAIINPYIQAGIYLYNSISAIDRIALRAILSGEQNHHCCYCMRYTPEALRTVEHIIPKAIAFNDFGRAYRHLGGGLYKNNILHVSRYTPIAFPLYYPHPLAYGNLTMACEVCNEEKADEQVRPLFFANPVVGISYNEKGRMVLAQKDSLPEDLKVRINNDNFVCIRSIWRGFKLANISVENVENANDETSRLALLQQALPYIENRAVKNEIENKGGVRFTAVGTWTELLSFSWFWSYYQ